MKKFMHTNPMGSKKIQEYFDHLFICEPATMANYYWPIVGNRAALFGCH
jgi:hypothetical protein